jgi:hypothetical protein
VTDERYKAACGDVEVEAVEDLDGGAGGVGERDVFELDVA